MNKISLQTIEKLIFENHKIRDALPEYKDMFKGWAFSKQSPELKAMGQKILIDLLDKLTDNDLEKINNIYESKFEIEKLKTNITEHYNCSINEAEDNLNAQTIIKDIFFIYREKDLFYLTTWR